MMDKGIVKIGSVTLREFTRASASLNRKEDGEIETRVHIQRKKTADTSFAELVRMGQVAEIRFYGSENDLENDIPLEVYDNMVPTETELSIHSPHFSVQERLVFCPASDGTEQSD